MQTLRFADSETAGRYPLPVQGALAWHAGDRGFGFELALPPLPTGSILVPSVVLQSPSGPADAYRYRWMLNAGHRQWALQPVPSQPVPGDTATRTASGPDAASGPYPAADPEMTLSDVTTHIDCFHTHRALNGLQLHLQVECATRPDRYLVCVSARPLALAGAAAPVPDRSTGLAEPPPPCSQMTAPAEIARRICSPTCVSMVLAHHARARGTPAPDWRELVDACHDPASRLYGSWPLALEAARHHGSLGAVEVFAGWEEPLQVLDRGIPLVTSIRFAEGRLPGAPLDSTSGHLVVVHRAGPDRIGVCDPAAASAADVSRSYPARAFSETWLRHRGAAYILPP